MNKRINQYDLGVALTLLNRVSGRKFGLDYAYGDARLTCDGGSKEVSERMSKRELYNHIKTSLNILSEHKQTYVCL